MTALSQGRGVQVLHTMLQEVFKAVLAAHKAAVPNWTLLYLLGSGFREHVLASLMDCGFYAAASRSWVCNAQY